MEIKSVIKVQFGQLNDKRFYLSNGLVSLPFGHPYLEELRKGKHKYRAIHKIIQEKKYDFLKEQSKVLASKIQCFKTNFWSKSTVIRIKFCYKIYYNWLEVN